MTEQKLKSVAPSQIKRNDENPRLLFRQEEMESLMQSIDTHGIQVPLTVYEDGDHYTLIDGERRWRCASKLNLKRVPVLVQEKPSELQNLVLMYNIHALREQWDYYTIASKLQRVIALYAKEHGQSPNEQQLSELTGLTRGAIRRCQLLMDLPERFKSVLLQELAKPKTQQRLTEDFFLEMEKSLRAVLKRLPDYEPQLDKIRDVLIAKFQKGSISAVTDFRQLSKIATAVDTLGVAQSTARRALDAVFDPHRKEFGIRDAYSRTVAFEYEEKQVSRYTATLSEFITAILEGGKREELDEALLNDLRELYKQLRTLLRD